MEVREAGLAIGDVGAVEVTVDVGVGLVVLGGCCVVLSTGHTLRKMGVGFLEVVGGVERAGVGSGRRAFLPSEELADCSRLDNGVVWS